MYVLDSRIEETQLYHCIELRQRVQEEEESKLLNDLFEALVIPTITGLPTTF